MKHETVDIALTLIVLKVIVNILNIYAINKKSAWYFYLFCNVNKHVLQIIS